MARIRGISEARTGSWVGEAIPGRVTRQFPAPALESVVEPVDRAKAAGCSLRCGNSPTPTR